MPGSAAAVESWWDMQTVSNCARVPVLRFRIRRVLNKPDVKVIAVKLAD